MRSGRKLGVVMVIVITGLLGATVVSSAQAHEDPPTPQFDCMDTVLAATGHGQRADRLMFHAPPGWHVEYVDYENDPWRFDYGFLETDGANHIQHLVNAFRHQCAGGPKLVITGFSLGALVAGRALEQIPEAANTHGVLFSDGRRPPGSYGGDPGGTLGGPTGGLGGPLGLTPGYRERTLNPTLSLCHVPDFACNAGPEAVGPGLTHYLPGWYDFDPVQALFDFDSWGESKNQAYCVSDVECTLMPNVPRYPRRP